jgi:hypothetical protein
VDPVEPDDESGVSPAGGAGDDDGRRDGDRSGEHGRPLPGLPPDWAALVIPDDASALDAEAAVVRAELARERRRHRWRHAFRMDQLASYGLSAPLIGLVLLVVVSFASLLVVVLPGGSPVARPAPLGRPLVLPGREGGLLPDVRVTDAKGQPFPARDLRPGAILLVGDSCDCASLITEYTHATAEARVRLLIVGEQRTPFLPSDDVRGRVMVVTDPERRLALGLLVARDTGPAAVLVRPDGVIHRIAMNARNVVTLRTELAALT